MFVQGVEQGDPTGNSLLRKSSRSNSDTMTYKSVQRDLDQLRGLWTKPLLGPQEGGSGLGKPRRITGLGKLKSLEEEIGNDEEEFEREIGNENKDGSNGNRILYLFFNDNGKCMRLTRSGKYLTSDRDEELRKLSNIKEM